MDDMVVMQSLRRIEIGSGFRFTWEQKKYKVYIINVLVKKSSHR
jgi:hypothetical protein